MLSWNLAEFAQISVVNRSLPQLNEPMSIIRVADKGWYKPHNRMARGSSKPRIVRLTGKYRISVYPIVIYESSEIVFGPDGSIACKVDEV